MNINTEQYTAETIINELKNKTIDDVLKKYNLTLQELFYIQSKKGLYTPSKKRKPTHITRTKRKTYLITKTMDSKTRNYGEYKTRKEAETIVKELKKVYWNKDKLECIKSKCGISEYNE